MSATAWTGSRWAHVPQLTPVRDRHNCRGDLCRSCNAAIEADGHDAEYGEHGDEMDARADRDAGGLDA